MFWFPLLLFILHGCNCYAPLRFITPSRQATSVSEGRNIYSAAADNDIENSDVYIYDSDGFLVEHGDDLPRIDRRPVPHMISGFVKPVLQDANNVSCPVAHIRCTNRAGCGLALKNYMVGCADLVLPDLTNSVDATSALGTAHCSRHCQQSLVALMSTKEGNRLMKCDCQNDTRCLETKFRLEPCRSAVTQSVDPSASVSCSTAQWICAADPGCRTALDYYTRECQQMFRGDVCSARCLNSVKILQRQKGAFKLESCKCTSSNSKETKGGRDPLDDVATCLQVKRNTRELCFENSQSSQAVQNFHTKNLPLNLLLVCVCIYYSTISPDL